MGPYLEMDFNYGLYSACNVGRFDCKNYELLNMKMVIACEEINFSGYFCVCNKWTWNVKQNTKYSHWNVFWWFFCVFLFHTFFSFLKAKKETSGPWLVMILSLATFIPNTENDFCVVKREDLQSLLIIHLFTAKCNSGFTRLKVKAIPAQSWTGPEGSRRLRLPDFKIIGTWRW